MPTYSDEDGLTDAARGSGDDPPAPYSGDTEEIPAVRPPAYPAEPPYATGVYNADPYAGDPYSAEAYNSTDILPAAPAGGRRARREAAAAAAAAGAVPFFDQEAPYDEGALTDQVPPIDPGEPYDQVEAREHEEPAAPVADARFEPDPVPDMGSSATGLAAAGLAAAQQVEYDEAARAAAPDAQGGYDAGSYDQDSSDQGAYDHGSYDHGANDPGAYDPGAYDAPADEGGTDGSGGDEPPRGRRDWTPTPLGRVVLPLALALVSVVALWAAWSHLSSDDQSTASPGTSATAPVVGPSGSTSPSTSPTGTSPSSSASSSPSASASGSHSTAPSGSPSATATTPAAATVDRSVPVVVLNATGRPGLAARVAAQLRAKGWKVTSVGNWTRGGISATTIFLNGHVDAARTITGDFPQASGAIQLPKPGMPPLRMVIVVGNDYPR